MKILLKYQCYVITNPEIRYDMNMYITITTV